MSERQPSVRARPTDEARRAYYDERVDGKLLDFVQANPRIEAAVRTIAEWAPPRPKRILEIGCGIGATSWRMARAWPDAEVIGIDLSPVSIDVANACFERGNLAFKTGVIREDTFIGKFDLIVLMDVYEHVAPPERALLHQVLRALLSEESRLILTVPSPETQERARRMGPPVLQPVDEDVRLDEIQVFVRDTRTDLLLYRKVCIWRSGDYVHVVCGRIDALASVESRRYFGGVLSGLRTRVRGLMNGSARHLTKSRDYLGPDPLGPRRQVKHAAFRVTLSTRVRLARLWAGSAGRTAVSHSDPELHSDESR